MSTAIENEERKQELEEALRSALKIILDTYTRIAMEDGYWPDIKPVVDQIDTVLAKSKSVKLLTNKERIANKEKAIERFNSWPKWKREAFSYRRQS